MPPIHESGDPIKSYEVYSTHVGKVDEAHSTLIKLTYLYTYMPHLRPDFSSLVMTSGGKSFLGKQRCVYHSNNYICQEYHHRHYLHRDAKPL